MSVPVGLCFVLCFCRSVFITWLRLWSVLYHVTVPVGLCFFTWPRLSVCALSRDLSVSLCFIMLLCLPVCIYIMWRCLSALLYHVTVPVSLCLSSDCACRFVSITWLCLSACALSCVSVGLYLSRDCAFGLCFITWPCLWVCALSRDCAGRSVLYHVTVPICVCSIICVCAD